MTSARAKGASPISVQSFAPPRPRGPAGAVVAASLLLVLTACSTGAGPSATRQPSASAVPPSVATSAPTGAAPGSASNASASGSITLYSSVTQNTIDAVLAAFAEEHPAVDVELFRAPSGELSARIAADLRDQGRIGGDVLWTSDPPSVQGYDADGLLRRWSPPNAADLDPAYVNDTYWGTRVLNMVIVRGADADPVPAGWDDLTESGLKDAVVIPNPSFAGSALGALAYFAQAPEFGIDYYRRLKDNGAVQVNAIDEVITGVAEGRFKAGMTLDFSTRAAIEKGSPIELVWPEPGAIAIYSPIAVVDATENAAAAEAFTDFVLSPAGQTAIAGSGWEPVRAAAGGPEPEGEQLRPDWAATAGRQEELLEEYATIFGD